MQLARTTGGRLNDYVTTTALQLSENNNHGLGRILRPSKIKGEWEPDRQREGGREGGRVGAWFYGDHEGAYVSLTVLQSQASALL